MNHKRAESTTGGAGQRRKVRATLLTYRRRTGRTPEDIAAQLGWPIAFYLQAEAGKAGLSPGQKEDVKEMQAAAVRDRLRAAGRAKGIPLIGGTRVVEHKPEATSTGRMHAEGVTGRAGPALWIDMHSLPRDPEGGA